MPEKLQQVAGFVLKISKITPTNHTERTVGSIIQHHIRKQDFILMWAINKKYQNVSRKKCDEQLTGFKHSKVNFYNLT